MAESQNPGDIGGVGPRQRYRFEILLAALLVLLLGYPLAFETRFWVVPIVIGIAVAGTAQALSAHWIARWLAILLALLAVAGSIARMGGASGILSLGGLVAELGLYLLAVAVMFPAVFRREAVHRGTLFGAAGHYLLIVLVFGSAYRVLEVVSPGSFSFPDGTATAPDSLGLLYFSFVTLTTLGYGDILPLAESARSLVILECVIGILYPSILIARLVSLYASGDTAVAFPRPEKAGRFAAGPLEVLFVAMVLMLASYPYVSVELSALVRAVVLLASLWAVRRWQRLFLVGIPVVLTAIAATFWPGDAGSALRIMLASGLTALTLAVVAGLLSVGVLRIQEVNQEVLFGAGCAFLLIGGTFTHAYAFLHALEGATFALPAGLSADQLVEQLTYFSFVTLTTLGYGEIVPLSPWGQLLIVVESVIGVLFPAILVARLVSLYR